uniref:Tonsoku-like protein n=1 Tax=Saccoglossus kowalevskii TaxID=10224 RepID=A0ABM0MXK8_SACKO|nr:PREDICTED: tonsoku-like protein-like [Saccoglossus kowalevskii]
MNVQEKKEFKREYEEAIQEHRAELHLSESQGDIIGSAIANRKIGECYSELNKYDIALKYQNKHLELAQSVNNHVEEQRALATIGRTYLCKSDAVIDSSKSQQALQKAQESFIKSLDVCDKLKNTVSEKELQEMRARLFLNLGLVFDNQQDQKNCIKFIRQSIYIAEKHKLHEDLFRSHFSLGSIYQKYDSNDKSLRCLEAAIKCAKNMKDKYLESDALGCCALLKCAMALGKPNTELIPIYISLAATYQDNKDHSKAIECYRKELELRHDNPKESVKTWLNIALSQEECQHEYHTLYQSYKEAMNCAERANVPKLQLRTLKSLCLVQEKFKQIEMREATLEKLSVVKEQYNLDSDDDLSGVDDTETQESSENVESEDLELSDSDDSDTDEYGLRKGKDVWNKRNEKGETPLHRAAIDGNFNMVIKLVEQGHPVNCRDYCGWLPLHEACNFGYCEIVCYLLDHGAYINDRGGEGCQGVTPLHDAINCGNMDVAKLLIEKGANVLAKDDEGNTPSDTLIKWKEMYQADIDAETQNECREIMSLLKNPPRKGNTDKFVKNRSLENLELYDNGQNNSVPSPKSSRQVHESCNIEQRKTPSNRDREVIVARRRNVIDLDDEDSGDDESSVLFDDASQNDVTMVSPRSPTPPPPFGDETPQLDSMETGDEDWNQNEFDDMYDNPLLADLEDFTESSSATDVYQDAINKLGSAINRTSSQRPQQRTSTQQTPALVPEENYIADDWLIDDVAHRPAKRKRFGIESAFKTLGSSQDRTTSGNRPKNSLTVGNRLSVKHKAKRSKQMKLTNMAVSTTRRAHNDVSPSPSDDNDDVIIESQSNDRLPEMPHTVSNNTVTNPVGAPMRVRVKVQDKTFLIPVPSRDKAISWLTEQSAQRYYNSTGLRPNLVLVTAEGALFSPEDTVMDVVSLNEEIVANIQSWDLQPLPDRYTKACEAVNKAEHKQIQDILSSQHISPQLNFKDLSLTTEQVIPLFRSLQRQYSIKQLLFPGNNITDAALDSFVRAIVTVPNLSVLDLSCNAITHKGLQIIADSLESSGNVATGDNKPFQMLEVLDLSYNHLSDCCTQPLSSIIKHCPSLMSLNLTSCDLTVKFFQLYRRNLQDALKGAAHLQSISVSHNALGPTGIELLLKSISCDVTDCILQNLNLSGCFLTNEDLMEVTTSFSTNESLVSLHLSGNSKVSNYGVQNLLENIQDSFGSLEELDLSGCGLSSPLGTLLLEAFSKKKNDKPLLKQLRMPMNGISENDKQNLIDLWKSHHHGNAAWFFDSIRCVFYTTKDLYKKNI